MENIELIEEIREKIDKLDLEILDLIESRKKLVDEVVKLKTKEQIVDQKRIEKILNKLDKQSIKMNLPEGMIVGMWKKMISGFIEYEKKYFEDNTK
jgi:isochorismate pyruvate lyase